MFIISIVDDNDFCYSVDMVTDFQILIKSCIPGLIQPDFNVYQHFQFDIFSKDF